MNINEAIDLIGFALLTTIEGPKRRKIERTLNQLLEHNTIEPNTDISSIITNDNKK